jgi:hypothetical protein
VGNDYVVRCVVTANPPPTVGKLMTWGSFRFASRVTSVFLKLRKLFSDQRTTRLEGRHFYKSNKNFKFNFFVRVFT